MCTLIQKSAGLQALKGWSLTHWIFVLHGQPNQNTRRKRYIWESVFHKTLRNTSVNYYSRSAPGSCPICDRPKQSAQSHTIGPQLQSVIQNISLEYGYLSALTICTTSTYSMNNSHLSSRMLHNRNYLTIFNNTNPLKTHPICVI
jgi:hypothetical protein